MAINRYDTPARSEFINTYVPIPFEQMVAAGQVQQQRYDQAAAALDQKLADAANLKAIPNSVDYQYIQGVQSQMRDIADEYAQKDLANPVIRRQLNQKIRGSIDASRIRAIQDSYAGWATQQQHKARLISRRQYNEYIDEDPSFGYDSRGGVYNYLTPAYEDPRATLEALFNSPAYLRGRTLGNTPEGYTRIGRTMDDVNEIAESQWYDVLQTPAGQDIIKIYRGQNPLSEESDETIIKEWIRDVGRQEYTFEGIAGSRTPQSRQTSDKDVDYTQPEISRTPQWSLAGQGERSRDIRRNTPSVEDMTGVIKTGGFNRWLRRMGKIGDPDYNKDEFDAQEAADAIKGDPEAQKKYDELLAQATTYFGEGQMKGLSDVEKYKKVDDYIKDFHTAGFDVPVLEYNEAKRQRETQALFFDEDQSGNVQAINRPFYDPTDKVGTLSDFGEILEEYPMDQYQYNVIGEISNNNPVFPGGRQVGIFGTDEKGNLVGPVKTVYMGADDIESGQNQFAWDVHQANYNIAGTREVNGSIPLPNGQYVKISGNVDRSDKKISGGKHSAFVAKFTFQGPNGPVTINVGSHKNPMRSTEDILLGLLSEIGAHFGVEQ